MHDEEIEHRVGILLPDINHFGSTLRLKVYHNLYCILQRAKPKATLESVMPLL